MALTRKMLKAMGIEDDKIEQILDAHTETFDSIKKERDHYKELADKLPDLQEEYNKLKAAMDDGGYQEKYENEHKALEDLKAKIALDEENRVKASLYRSILEEAGIDEKRIDSVLRVKDLKELKVTDGKLDNESGLIESVKKEWSDFIVVKDTKGADPDTPPGTDNPTPFDKMSLAEQMAYANQHPGSQDVKNWLG